MALLRKFFYRKQPDGLLEISERVYVFDCCFTTDILEDDEYKVYIGGIVSQLREYSSDASFMVFNFREGDNQSQMTSILSDYDMTVMDYPRHYEGCPLLTVEMIHHFLKSSESWLSLGQQNVLLMHCEQGGWPVLAFMLATLLIYRKQFSGEQRTLEMIYKQAPRELLQLMSPLNPLPSQLRYLQYVSRRNVGSRWPPVDRALTLDCIILRVIPNMDGEGGCCPIFRIYGPDPLMASDRAPKVLFSASKRGKHVRHYKQADSDLIKLDIHCHVQGDVVMECISLDGDQEREQMMFRVMFNTAFIRSNILMLNRDEIDTLWNAKDHFPKDFRAEVLFSEMDSTGSLASIDLPTLEEKDGLPMEAFAKVQEIFSNMDWLETKPDVAANVLQHIVAIQEKLDPGSPQGLNIDPVLLGLTLEKVQGKLQLKEEENQSQSLRTDMIQKKSVTSPRPSSDVSSTSLKVETQQSEFAVQTMFSTTPSSNISIVQKKLEPHELQIALQRSAQSKFISQRVPQTSLSSPASCSSSQGSPVHTSRYQAPSAIGITALLHDDSPSNDDEVVRPVTVSLPSSAISSPITKLPKFAQLHTVSSPRTPPPPPPTLTPLSRSELNRTDSLVNKICEVSSSGTNSPPALPSLPVSSSPASTIKSSSSAPLPAPPPLPSFSGGSQLSAIDKLPSPPSISELSPSPILNSSSLTAPSLPPPTSFTGASPSSFSMVLPPTPPPPPPSLTRASSSTFSMAPPAPPPPSFPRASPSSSSMAPPPPPTPLVTSSVSCSVSSSSQPVKNLAIPETPPPLVPLQSGSAMGLGSAVPVPPSPPPSKSVPKDSLSIKSAQPPPVPPPAAPFLKGLSKASSASPPAHSGVSNGNVPSVPGPPPCAPFNMKGWSLSHTSLRNQAQPRKANLKPYHWLKLTRAMQGSIWAEAQKSDEASKAPEFDMSELESLFSAASPSSGPVSTGRQSNRRSSGAKSEKVQLIELRRAYNCEIMLSKVKVPLGDLTSSVLALDESALDVDQVDNLIKFCPTKEEMDLLKGYNGDKGNLGRCEEFFLELMKVPRVESKLRVFSFKLQFHHQVSDLRSNLNTINSASEEIRSSVKLKRIMQTILSLGNALNQGTARGSAVGFRLDSLLKLIDTRARNNKMTLMHYLCKVLAEKLPELLDFPKDLGSLETATKIQLKYLAEEMQAINKGLEKVVQELTASENDGPVSEYFCQTLKGFLSCAESEVRSLASLYSNVGRNADALALYFGEDPARCPFEQVVSTLLNFVRMFTRAHEQNCKQLEIEERKAEKDAENEKLKMGMAKKESENLIRTPIRSGNV